MEKTVWCSRKAILMKMVNVLSLLGLTLINRTLSFPMYHIKRIIFSWIHKTSWEILTFLADNQQPKNEYVLWYPHQKEYKSAKTFFHSPSNFTLPLIIFHAKSHSDLYRSLAHVPVMSMWGSLTKVEEIAFFLRCHDFVPKLLYQKGKSFHYCRDKS